MGAAGPGSGPGHARGGRHRRSGEPTSRARRRPTPARQELIDEGDEICDDELGGLQNLPAPSILRDAVVQLRFLEGRYRSAALRMRAAPAPAADRDELELIFVQLEQVGDLIGRIAGAIEVGDVERGRAAASADEPRWGRTSTARMRAYGFEGC